MSIGSNQSRVVFSGNGKTRDFDFPFKIWKAEQARVFVSDTAYQDRDVTAAVTVSVKENGGGTVTFKEAPAAGVKIAILRAMPFVQEDQYTRGARFDPYEVEERLDIDCAERQQLFEGLARAVKMPATGSGTPEQYQQDFFNGVEAARTAATSAINSTKTSALAEIATNKNEAKSAAAAAKESEAGALASFNQARSLVANEMAQALRQALNAADSAKGFAADVEGAVVDAAQEAADCIISRLRKTAAMCQSYASAAASSVCAAAASSEKTWRMVRNMTEAAGRAAAACILERVEMYARVSAANCQAAAASARSGAGYASSMALIIRGEAQKAAEAAAADVADCIENICLTAAETSQDNARVCAEQAAACAAISAAMQKSVAAFARQAAAEAAEQTAACCGEVCNQLAEIAATHAGTAQANAKMALGYAKMAQQTDICQEAATRRAKDEDLEARIAILESGGVTSLEARLIELEGRPFLFTVADVLKS